MGNLLKPVHWVESSRKDLRAFPIAVRRNIGQALYAAQRGEEDPSVKPLRGFGSAAGKAIVDRHQTDTYRAVYTVHFQGVIYVLHAFQKKSTTGIKTPKKDMDLIKQRLEAARKHFGERQNIISRKKGVRALLYLPCSLALAFGKYR